jgi:hypothetical protein
MTVLNLQIRFQLSKVDQNVQLYLLKINIKTISSIKNLMMAYRLTKNETNEIFRKINNIFYENNIKNLQYLLSIQSELNNGIFEFKPIQTKSNLSLRETKSIFCVKILFKEKIIQNALFLVRQKFYERKFVNSLNIFRNDQEFYTILFYLKIKLKHMHYIIKCNSFKKFNSNQYKLLFTTFQNDINCEKTLKLIKSILNSSYINFNELYRYSCISLFQISKLTFFFCNIFLHKFDEFIKELQLKYEKYNSNLNFKNPGSFELLSKAHF